MKKIKIYSVLSNHENETTTVEALANYDEVNNTITYQEEELNTTLEILDNKVRIIRKNEDYDLNLEFKENEVLSTKYTVKSLGLDVDIDVHTKVLEIEDNRIYINYELFNENRSIGSFEYKLLFKE